MGWLIDPKEQSVFAYLSDRPTAVYDQPKAQLLVPDFAKDFSLTVEDLSILAGRPHAKRSGT
ncbi:hypothetical protein [Chlorogloeopsis fritschii]|uniref:hypothetical protein n=1 Tax=Chlorogloeopsis fritschii TaxID=1124 RepID=UPI0030B848BC